MSNEERFGSGARGVAHRRATDACAGPDVMMTFADGMSWEECNRRIDAWMEGRGLAMPAGSYGRLNYGRSKKKRGMREHERIERVAEEIEKGGKW